jgi:phospholipid/cholesterol/gamma-HCH transport system substrate-binding protein
MKSAKVHYIHSLSYSARDRLVGVFVLVALLMVLGLFAIKVKSLKVFDRVVHYQTFMKNAQGISPETIVNISGIDVGRVTDIVFRDKNEINIHFFVYKNFQDLVRADSTGEVSKLSLVGDNIIIIKPGSPNLPMLSDDAIIPIKEPLVTDYLMMAEITPAIKKFATLIADLSQVIDAIDPKLVKDSSQHLQAVLADLRNLGDQVADGKGSIGRIFYDKNQEQSVARSLLLLEKNLSGISQRVNETRPMIANVNKLALESKRMLTDATKLSSESQQLIVDVRRSVYKVDQQLNHLPDLINNTHSVLESSEQTLKGIQSVHVFIDNKIWPFSSTTKPADSGLLIEDAGLND